MAFNFNKIQQDLSNYEIADDNYYKSYVYFYDVVRTSKHASMWKKTTKKVQISEMTMFVIEYTLCTQCSSIAVELPQQDFLVEALLFFLENVFLGHKVKKSWTPV